MRDPMSWALPVFRAFGVQVKVHLFFFVIVLGLFLRQVSTSPYHWTDVFVLTVVIVFVTVLLHEYGHCFGARHVGGDAKEILIWPLGGLAFVEVPHNWKANFIATAAGPAVNLAICVGCSLVLAAGQYVPSLNPFTNPYHADLYKFDGRTYKSHYVSAYYSTAPGQETQLVSPTPAQLEAARGLPADAAREALAREGVMRALAPAWAVWTYRVFWISWWQLLFNLIPAFPLDGGRLLQSLVWWRTESYRRGTTVAAYSGIVVSVIFLVISIAVNESLLMGLALFMLYSASVALMTLEMEEGPFGYDFSAGYTSLEKDDEPPPKPKQPGRIARWLAARKARKIQREVEAKARDEERVDQLLDKIARTGKDSLTDEEKRFLQRASARYKHRS